MLTAFRAADVRAAEEPLLAAGVPLMERAAWALAGVVSRHLTARRGGVYGARVVLLVGGGNNGGDALHAGAFLARRGAAVQAVLTTERPHGEGLAALRRTGARVVSLAGGGAVPGVWLGDAVAAAFRADVVVDGLLGIGARGALRGPARDLVAPLAQLLAADPAPDRPVVVAVDVPSGIGVDDGSVPGPVLPADVTVTFGAWKPGLLLPPAARLTGRVEAIDLGLGLGAPVARGTDLAADDAAGAGGARPPQPAVCSLEPSDVADLWPVPGPEDDKYSRGVLGVVAGGEQYPGAAVLTVAGAVRAGLGMVRFLGPRTVTDAVLAAHPEAVPAAGQVQAWALGPGVAPDDAEQAARVREALSVCATDRLPAVVDAGALHLIPDRLPPWVVLTPHAGELARLLSARGEPVDRQQVEGDPTAHAARAGELTGATVLLKGSATLVASPGGPLHVQADAPPWLATAGAGDVLTGVLGALLAGRSDDVVDDPALAGRLAAAAASVHGRAATAASSGGPITARDVAEAVRATVRRLLRER